MQDFFNVPFSEFLAFEAKFMSEFYAKNSSMYAFGFVASTRELRDFFQVTSRAIVLRECYTDLDLIKRIQYSTNFSFSQVEKELRIPRTSLSRAKKIGLTPNARRKICYFLSIYSYQNNLIAKFIG